MLYVRLSDHLKCCEERTLVILHEIISFVWLGSVHFSFHNVLQNNKIVELLPGLLLYNLSLQIFNQVINADVNFPDFWHSTPIAYFRSRMSYFALISRVPVLNLGSQKTSWEPYNQLPIGDPLVSLQTLLTTRSFLPSPQASRRHS